jgi:hypothetical protein
MVRTRNDNKMRTETGSELGSCERNCFHGKYLQICKRQLEFAMKCLIQ